MTAPAGLSFIPAFEDIEVSYDPGAVHEVRMHDGSRLQLRKLEEDYDASDRAAAVARLMEAQRRGEVLTGLFFLDPEANTLVDSLRIVDEPLATLPESTVRPPLAALAEIVERLK